MAILETKIMQLDRTLSSLEDTKGNIVTFKQDKNNSDTYIGKGSDGYNYFIEIKKPIYCEVKRVKE